MRHKHFNAWKTVCLVTPHFGWSRPLPSNEWINYYLKKINRNYNTRIVFAEVTTAIGALMKCKSWCTIFQCNVQYRLNYAYCTCLVGIVIDLKQVSDMGKLFSPWSNFMRRCPLLVLNALSPVQNVSNVLSLEPPIIKKLRCKH